MYFNAKPHTYQFIEIIIYCKMSSIHITTNIHIVRCMRLSGKAHPQTSGKIPKFSNVKTTITMTRSLLDKSCHSEDFCDSRILK